VNYDKLVAQISNFSFVAEELEEDSMEIYTIDLFLFALKLADQGAEHAKLCEYSKAAEKFKSSITLVQELVYESALQ